MKIRHIILSLILISTISSCKEDSNARIIKEWQGKKIELPSYFINIVDNDTVSTIAADFTIISYFDSLGCTSCKLHLSSWRNLFDNLIDNAQDLNINTLLLINSNKNQEIKKIIDEEFYHYPVILDYNDSINHMNKFPNDEFFRTFLLDKDHKIIAIGNPLYSKGIEDLYLSIITGQKNFSSDYTSAIFVDKTLHNFGKVKLGKLAEKTFIIKNIGTDTVIISNIDSSCDCTTAIPSSTIINPKESINLTVRFKEDSLTGEFYRTLSISYNNIPRPTIITIKGVVIDNYHNF